MKTFALAIGTVAALGVAGCQQSTSNDGTTTISTNEQIVKDRANDLANRGKEIAKDGVNLAREGLNELKPVTDELQNDAKAAYNEIKSGVRVTINRQ